MRVVSLVPSSTETLLALGIDVVACTRFCEQPDLVHVGGTKNSDVEAIVRLTPDLVVMDREENRLEDSEALREAGVALYVSDVKTIADAQTVVTDLANLAGVDNYSSNEPLSMPTSSVRHGSVFVPIWRRPWMSIAAATYGGSVLEHLGWSLVEFGDDAYPTIELADVVASRPSLVLTLDGDVGTLHVAFCFDLLDVGDIDAPPTPSVVPESLDATSGELNFCDGQEVVQTPFLDCFSAV
jgi:ABC-type Fe3+-hydroxamate transport system substrate-binding protein